MGIPLYHDVPLDQAQARRWKLPQNASETCIFAVRGKLQPKCRNPDQLADRLPYSPFGKAP
jgi:hypothetical protein